MYCSYYLLILIHICLLFKRYKNMHYVSKKFIDNIRRNSFKNLFFFNMLYIILYSKNWVSYENFISTTYQLLFLFCFILFIILPNKIKLLRVIIIWANNWNFIKFLSFYYIIRFENLRYYRFPWISNTFKPAYIFSHYFYFHFIRFHYSTSELNDISFFFPLHVPQYVNQNETMQNIKRIKKKKRRNIWANFRYLFIVEYCKSFRSE